MINQKEELESGIEELKRRMEVEFQQPLVDVEKERDQFKHKVTHCCSLFHIRHSETVQYYKRRQLTIMRLHKLVTCHLDMT